MTPEKVVITPVNRPVERAAAYYSSLVPWYDLLNAA